MLKIFFFFLLSRILAPEKDVLAIPSILLLYPRCDVFFYSRKLDVYIHVLPSWCEEPAEGARDAHQ